MFNYLQQTEVDAKFAVKATTFRVKQLFLKANISLLLALSIIPMVNGVALIA